MLNIGSYTFEEDLACNYPETVSFSNLPGFIKHNEASSDFSIPKTTDLGLIGSYTVTIRSEIQIPEDYTGMTFKTMFVEYDFTIFVGPCQFSTYTATMQVSDISYNIGSPGLINIGSYIFEEDPVCNYPETTTVTNLPTFVTHNEETSDFTISKINDLSLLG